MRSDGPTDRTRTVTLGGDGPGGDQKHATAGTKGASDTEVAAAIRRVETDTDDETRDEQQDEIIVA